MSTAPAEKAKPKGKMKLVAIVVGAVVLLGGGAGGAWFYFNKKAPHDEHAEEAAAPAPEKHGSPTYLALENMTVNLADPGGERFAQVGITLDLANDKTAEQVKAYLPAIRSNVLMLVSQRTSEELLKRDGKEKLADDVVVEVSRALGYEVDEPAPRTAKGAVKDADADEAPAPRKKKRRSAPTPVNGVLFSSFIVQ